MIIFRFASLCHAANTKDHNGNKSFFALFCVILGFGEHVIVLLVCDIVFNNAHYFILCYIVNYVYASFAEI